MDPENRRKQPAPLRICQQLVDLVAYDFYDPESVSAGTAGWGTPPLKTVTFGLNLNF